MMKSKIATLLIGAVVVGGGAVAYGQTQPSDPSLGGDSAAGSSAGPRRPARACMKAHRDNPGAAPSAECQQLREKFGARRGAGGGEHPLLRKGIHGEILVKDGDGFSTVIFDRGKVTAASGGSVTLERPDGKSVTVSTDDGTKYRGVDGYSSIRVGEPAFVVTKAGKTILVGQRPAEGTPGHPGAGDPPPGFSSHEAGDDSALDL